MLEFLHINAEINIRDLPLFVVNIHLGSFYTESHSVHILVRAISLVYHCTSAAEPAKQVHSYYLQSLYSFINARHVHGLEFSCCT